MCIITNILVSRCHLGLRLWLQAIDNNFLNKKNKKQLLIL